MSPSHMRTFNFVGENVSFSDTEITSKYTYSTTNVSSVPGEQKIYNVRPVSRKVEIKTRIEPHKTGIMLVGWGGNNGSTFTATMLANKHNLSWETKEGQKQSNFIGSIVKSSTISLGSVKEDNQSSQLYAPISELLPFVNTDNIEIDGWDISSMNLADAMKRAQVLDIGLQAKLYPFMKDMHPRKSVFDQDYVSASQADRADNVIDGTLSEQLEAIRADIRDFKKQKSLDLVIVMWTASTEKCVNVNEKAHEKVDLLMDALNKNKRHLISTSMIFAMASILEKCHYVNGSPQNTFVKSIAKMAEQNNVFLVGDDFKTGQTKVKSSIVEFLVGSGMKPLSIVSYNHLGNNDGANLRSPKQLMAKEMSKCQVIDELIQSSRFLYKEDERPDHCVVIKYVPCVGDTKRALDEYISEICMGARNTLAMYQLCEDSLLAVPVMLDIILFVELFTRITVRSLDNSDSSASEPHKMCSPLSALGFMFKSPMRASEGEPLLNGFFAQRSCIENIIRACLGIPPQTYLNLEYKFEFGSSDQK